MRVRAMNQEFDEAACGGRVEGYSMDRPAGRRSEVGGMRQRRPCAVPPPKFIR
jgi:hypothetical protein